MLTTLEGLIETAQKTGWAAGDGDVGQIQSEAMSLKLSPVPIRQGADAVTTLRPMTAATARPNSLSARYGNGTQPLHTDGAHLVEPPDLVVLVCESASATPTLLWRRPRRSAKGRVFRMPIPDHLAHGVFLVSNGKDSFFTTAYAQDRFRYDPGCMEPCDARARATVRYFGEALKSAVEHSWNAPGTVLVVDNRQALHARASAVDDPNRELQRLSFHLKRSHP